MIRSLVVVTGVFLLAASALAGTGLAFLEIPVGGRESALGGSGAALVTGPTSVAYNPAAVAFTPRSVALMHTQHFGDTRAEFVGVTIRRGRFAVSPHYWGTRVADIEYRTQATREPISTFDAINSVAGAAIAMQIGGHYSAGVTARYLYQKIHVESSDGFAMDAGIMARELVPGLDLGLSAQNMGHVNSFINDSPNLPTTLRGGAAYERALPKKAGTIMLTAEGQAVRDNKPLFHGGIEYRAPDYVALRVGYVEGLEAQDISLGFGVFIKTFRLDYAFIPFRENLGEGHRFSFSFDI